ncbi:MAG: translation initiation factor [Flavobacteriaceae bacterium]|nr:translation initiation factor [Flavobacteriaceae bacterium]|tara:strand:+ start:535 stop:876 length:342 start_codon:yes stop_codon:yes gene_type:complete
MKKFSSLSDLKSLINNSGLSSDNSSPANTKSKLKIQSLEAHYSIKGRAGKPVTIIKGFEGTKNEIKDLAKLLKNKCGVGGSIKNSEIIIQGKYRDKITSILTEMGHSVKRIGG